MPGRVWSDLDISFIKSLRRAKQLHCHLRDCSGQFADSDERIKQHFTTAHQGILDCKNTTLAQLIGDCRKTNQSGENGNDKGNRLSSEPTAKDTSSRDAKVDDTSPPHGKLPETQTAMPCSRAAAKVAHTSRDPASKYRRGRGARKNNAYWRQRNNEVNTNPFNEYEVLFEDRHGSLKASRMANLDTQLQISKHKGDDLVMSSHCAKDLGILSRISSDFEDPCLRSISGHSTAVKGILRDVQFRLKGGSVTFRRDFWVSDSINDVVDVMIGANFIKDHFRLLFEKVKECVSTFATWFSKKKETPEQKAEREERERQQQIQILENEAKRLREESETYKQSERAKGGSQQGGSQRAPLAGHS